MTDRCTNCGRTYVKKRDSHRFCSRSCQYGKQPEVLDTTTHLVIPDTQAKPGVPNDHLVWINQYVKDRYAGKPLVLVHLGDHWDMPSLSSYDKGKGAMEGRRYTADIDSGNRAFELLDEGLSWPGLRKVFLTGNHEHRIARAAENDPQLEGLVTLEHLGTGDWEVYDFLAPVEIDGVVYAHYFVNPMTGRPYSGENTTLRLKNLGHSFTMGHQQTLQYALRFVNGRSQHGLVAGACYQHDEVYKGPQGNAHWRGLIVKNNVEEGSYDPMFVRLDYLSRRYEGVRLRDWPGYEL